MNIFKKINELNDLTNNEQLIADYIHRHPQEFLSLKPKEIADRSYVSLPTLYRLVNKLGLRGINDLKISVAAALNEKEQGQVKNFDFPILPTDTNYEAMLRLKEVYEHTIQDTLNLIDPDTLVAITDCLIQASMIDVYAASANVYFAENFQFQMQEINGKVSVPKEDYIQHLTAANSDETHVAILISFGGRGTILPRIVNILKANHVPIVLLTGTKENPLCTYADHILLMSSFENHYHKLSSFATRMTLLYLLDTLYSAYFMRNYEENLQKKLCSYQKINEKLL